MPQQRYDAVIGTRPPNASGRARLPLVTRFLPAPQVVQLAEKDLCPAWLPPPRWHKIVVFTGSGDTSTQQFTITSANGGNWVMDYSYDCSGQLGGTGNFIVNEDAGNDSSPSAVAINNLDAGQTGAWHVHGDAGTHYLQIQTQCPYTIKVRQSTSGCLTAWRLARVRCRTATRSWCSARQRARRRGPPPSRCGGPSGRGRYWQAEAG